MSSPEAPRLSRRLLLAVLAGVVVLAVIVALAVTGGDDEQSPSSSASASASASDPTSASSAGAAPTSSAPPATPAPTGPTGNVDALPSELPEVGLQDEAQGADGVTVGLTDVSVEQVTGQGAGSVSGRAVRITVGVTNGSPDELSVSGVDVTAYTGSDRVPAAPVDDGGTVGLGGVVAPGERSSGSYLFTLPDDASTVTVLVAVEAGAPVLVFSGEL